MFVAAGAGERNTWPQSYLPLLFDYLQWLKSQSSLVHAAIGKFSALLFGRRMF